MVSPQADLGGREGVGGVAVGGDEVDADGVRQGCDEEAQGDDHGEGGLAVVGGDAGERGHGGAAHDAGDEPAGAALGVAAEAAHAEGDDGREADGLEEERHVQHRHAGPAALRDGRADEDDAQRQEGQEHPPRAHVPHHEDADEPARGEPALRARQQLRPERVVGQRLRVAHVVDEVRGDGDLRARVAELREGGVEEPVLLPERLVVGVGVRLGRLEGHVGVGDLGDDGQEEDDGEDEDEDGDGQVHPLHVAQRLGVVEGEEDVRAQHGRHDGADAVEGLRDVDTDFRVSRRSAHCMSVLA